MVKRLWMLVTLGLLALSSIGLMTGCTKKLDRETERVVPELVLEDLKFRIYRDAHLAARGTAARANYRRDSDDFSAEQIQVTLEQARDGRVSLVAQYGRGNARSRDFFTWGGIQLVQKEKGTTAITEEARYHPVDGLVRGDRPITIQGPNYTLSGPGFFLDPRTEAMSVIGGTQVTAEKRKSQ